MSVKEKKKQQRIESTVTHLTTHTDPWRYKTNDTKTVTSEEKYIYFWYKNAAFSKFTFLWAWTCKHLSPHSWDQKQVKVTVYNEVGKGKKMILFQTVFNTMLTLDALRRDWRIERKLHNYIEEPSQWQGYNMYMAPLTLSLHFKVRGRERILHLCSSTKQKPPPPQGWHILRFSLQHGVWVNKTGRRRNVDHCTGGSISSSLRPVPSRVRAIYKEGERESLSLQQATGEGCRWHSKHSEQLPLHGRTASCG